MSIQATTMSNPDDSQGSVDRVPGLVSVIIPAYNYARYLPECVKSVLNQTYKKLEVLIVNDGSKDDTDEVSLKLAQSDPRVRYLPKPNGGLSSARNYGIAHARGEFLCYLDADDVFDPERLERHVRAFEQDRKATMVVGDETIGDDNLQPTVFRAKNFFLPPEKLINYTNLYAPFTPTLRADYADQVGPFDAYFKHCEDWEYWIRASRAGKVVYVPGNTGIYRRHATQMSSAWDEVTAWRWTIMKHHSKPWSWDRFDVWSFQQWYMLRGYKTQKRYLLMAKCLVLLAPQLVIPGRMRFLEKVFSLLRV